RTAAPDVRRRPVRGLHPRPGARARRALPGRGGRGLRGHLPPVVGRPGLGTAGAGRPGRPDRLLPARRLAHPATGRGAARPGPARHRLHRDGPLPHRGGGGRLPGPDRGGGLPRRAVVAPRARDPRGDRGRLPHRVRPTGGLMRIDETLRPAGLLPALTRVWEVSAGKIDSVLRTCPPEQASPVFTVEGRYTARGWTEWTRGFQYGSALLQFDATGEKRFLTAGRELTLTAMASHLTHTGVHDHGFNNVSTYGNLWRLAGEGRVDPDP